MINDRNNKAIQIAKRTQLFTLIKEVGILYGEEINSLREYAKEVVANNGEGEKLDKAIKCFEDVLATIRIIKRGETWKL